MFIDGIDSEDEICLRPGNENLKLVDVKIGRNKISNFSNLDQKID